MWHNRLIQLVACALADPKGRRHMHRAEHGVQRGQPVERTSYHLHVVIWLKAVRLQHVEGATMVVFQHPCRHGDAGVVRHAAVPQLMQLLHECTHALRCNKEAHGAVLEREHVEVRLVSQHHVWDVVNKGLPR